MTLAIPVTSPSDATPPRRRRRLPVILAALAAVGVVAAGATGAWTATRSHGGHRALPDMCAAVAAVEGAPTVPGSEPGSCTWSVGATAFTVSATLYERTRWRGADERAEAQFRYEQEGAVDLGADGSGYPKAYRAMPGTADGSFCLGTYDGAEYSVRCAVRRGNVVLNLTASWDDSTVRLRRDAVADVLTTFTPTTESLLAGLAGRL